MLFVFFFQAEDGIRDRNVTGVQTCALPISAAALREMEKVFAEEGIETEILHIGNKPIRGCIACNACSQKGRSEERRVGKEGRCRGRQGEERIREGNEDMTEGL